MQSLAAMLLQLKLKMRLPRSQRLRQRLRRLQQNLPLQQWQHLWPLGRTTASSIWNTLLPAATRYTFCKSILATFPNGHSNMPSRCQTNQWELCIPSAINWFTAEHSEQGCEQLQAPNMQQQNEARICLGLPQAKGTNKASVTWSHWMLLAKYMHLQK